MNDTRIIKLLVSLSDPKFALSALQSIANFGFGTLVETVEFVGDKNDHRAACPFSLGERN